MLKFSYISIAVWATGLTVIMRFRKSNALTLCVITSHNDCGITVEPLGEYSIFLSPVIDCRTCDKIGVTTTMRNPVAKIEPMASNLSFIVAFGLRRSLAICATELNMP